MVETTADSLRKQIESAQVIISNVAKETATNTVNDILKEKDDIQSYRSDFESDRSVYNYIDYI